MRIGVVINTCEPFYRGGYETRTWEFARALTARGHEVVIFTSCPATQIIDGVRFEPLAPPRAYFNSRGVRNLHADALFALATLRLSTWPEEFDLIDACATPFLHLLPLAHVCRVRGWPLVATCHEALLADIDAYVAERGVRRSLFGNLYASALKTLYRTAQRQPDQLLAVSNSTARGLESEGWGHVPVVEFGLRQVPTTMPTKPAASPIEFINVGRHTPIKRLDIALRAFHLVKQRGGAFRFHLVGTGAMEPALRALTTELDLTDAVIFHGAVDDDRRDELLATASVFVLTSLREGFSVATMEAMARGCAVLAASAPPPARPNAILDYLQSGHNALITDGSIESFANAILKLLQDRAGLHARQQAAFATAQSYRLEDKTVELEAFYRTIARASV